jgi:hypothetical protein
MVGESVIKEKGMSSKSNMPFVLYLAPIAITLHNRGGEMEPSLIDCTKVE